MWLLTKKCNRNSEEYVGQFKIFPSDSELIEYIPSITAVAILLDKGTSSFDGVEWLLVEL